MSTEIKYDSDVRNSILTGLNKVEKAVCSTLGPCGKNVLIRDAMGQPHITKDGVTVAQSIMFKDDFESLGASLIKEASSKMNNECGDGTTTVCSITYQIYKNGLKYLNSGVNATQLKSGIDKCANQVVEYIKTHTKPISTKDEIMKVALISANGDKEIAETIATVMDKIGNDGTIKVEDGQSTTMSYKFVPGMTIDRGYASPYFVTNEKMECNLENAFVLLLDKKLSNVQELIGVMQTVSSHRKPLFIMAEDFEGEVLSTIVMNKLRGFPILAVKSPSYGQQRKNILADIAILTGGQVVSDDTGVTLASATPESGILGQAKQITATQETCTIIDGLGDKATVDSRIAEIRTMISGASDAYTLKQLEERLAKLVGGVGIIQVGAQTEAELKERRDRVQDAFCSAKVAVKGGVVAGGGSLLLRAKTELQKSTDMTTMSEDEQIGFKVFMDSLSAPIHRICDNAGVNSSLIEATLNTMNDTSKEIVGFNALTKEYVPMIQHGIIDPSLVEQGVVKNAASIAGLLLTTDCMITETQQVIPTEQK